jgi:hypothetical protein
MERAILRLSPENFITVALLSGAAYLGVIGMQRAIAYASTLKKG